MKKISATTSQTQMGMPRNMMRRLGFFSTGRGSTVWQRQQTSLSSGFQVPHSVQSGIRLSGVRLVDDGAVMLSHKRGTGKRWAAGRGC